MNIELSDSTILNTIADCSSPTILRDSILTGFGVRIYSSGKASYFIEPTINGKSKRRVIGKCPQLSVHDARVMGRKKIEELTNMVPTSPTPVTGAQVGAPTLSVAYHDYLQQIQLKASSKGEYNRVYKHYLTPLYNMPLDQITEEIIINLYLENCKWSVAQSNKAMKIVQAVIRFSGLPNNPVTVLARRRLIRQLKPRTSHIPLTDIPLFYKGLEKVKFDHVRLYLDLLLHTGLRANEAMQITKFSVRRK